MVSPAEAAVLYIDGTGEAELEQVAAAVGRGAVPLSDVVQWAGGAAGGILPQAKAEAEKRCRSAELLYRCLAAAPAIPSEAHEPLLSFLQTRLHDFTAVLPLLQCARLLAERGGLSDAHFCRLMTAVMTECNVQAYEQPMRKEAMEFLAVALRLRPEQCRSQGMEWVARFVKIIDGERDPRILLRAFELQRTVMQVFNPEVIAREDPQMLEELFDVVSCYFPIAYQPPRNEPNPLGKEVIKEGVNAAMDHPVFATYCIPFLLDKLASPVSETKLDSLEMLRRVCRTYGEQAHLLFEPFIGDFWAQARTEALQGYLREDGPTVNSLMQTVCDVCGLITRFGSAEAVHAHLRPLFDGVLNMCSAPEGLMSRTPYSNLVHNAARSSPLCLEVVATRLVPLIHGVLLEKEDDQRRAESVVSIYAGVLRAATEDSAPREPPQAVAEQLALAARASVSVLEREGLVADLAIVAADAAASAALLPHGVTTEEVQKRAVGQVAAAAVGHQSADARAAALAAATRICERRPSDGIRGIVPGWMGVADRPDASAQDRVRVGDSLRALAEVDTLRLAVVCALSERIAAAAAAPDAGQWAAVLAAAARAAKPLPEASAEQLEQVRRLLGQLGAAATAADRPPAAVWDALLAGAQVAFSTLPAAAQPPALLAVGGGPGAADGSPVCCRAVCALRPPALAQLGCALLCALRPELALSDPERLAAAAFGGAPRADPAAEAPQRSPAAEACAAVANKCSKECALAVHGAADAAWSKAPAADALPAAGLLAKGLLMRGDLPEQAAVWTQRIVDALRSTPTASAAAAVLRSIVAPHPSLCKALRARSVLLWHQRFHTAALGQLTAAHAAAQLPAERAQLFAGVAGLLQEAPPVFVSNDAGRLAPLVIAALRGFVEGGSDPVDAQNAAAALGTLTALAAAPGGVAVIVGGALLGSLLDLAAFRPSKLVRERALSVLRCIAEQEPAAAWPHKGVVLRGTVQCTADHKRTVRTEAAGCRNAWFFLREPHSHSH
eukprot:TRINITY_DN19557_c0_g2_i3.p1 TRINITY_DN19557_c0_g2~~TRINITY_DN19557_c0_g2_i3.p1  ORF type:complete len:1012 (+),score=319.19 TRINITY_DN19557_c0_g2_i3:87-3122(+)